MDQRPQVLQPTITIKSEIFQGKKTPETDQRPHILECAPQSSSDTSHPRTRTHRECVETSHSETYPHKQLQDHKFWDTHPQTFKDLSTWFIHPHTDQRPPTIRHTLTNRSWTSHPGMCTDNQIETSQPGTLFISYRCCNKSQS